MSHKTLLKRFRGEASTSTAEGQGELEQVENTPTPMEVAEPDEPEPSPRRPRERFSPDELERLKKKYCMLRATIERKQRKYDWQNQCLNCVKRFDDIVRKVHSDLLAGRITMVGVTLTRKLPIKTRNRRVQTSPERVQPIPERVESSPERENSLTRDFCGGTDPSILEGGCQCDKCLVEHNADANTRFSRTKSRHHYSRIHRNRAHSPCKDDALTDLHQHVLAGDKKTPGSMYVGILASLHDQGPCEVPCKLRADVVWMNDHIPKQAETQTDLTGDADVKDQGTQTNLVKSVGIQKGKALARMIAARSSRYKSASTQLDLPELPPMHRPVGRVVPTVIHTRF